MWLAEINLIGDFAAGGMGEVPEQHFRAAMVVATNPGMVIGIFQFQFSELVHELKGEISGLFDAGKIQQAEPAMKGCLGWAVFLKNIGEDPIGKRGDVVFSVLELLEDIRCGKIGVVNRIAAPRPRT